MNETRLRESKGHCCGIGLQWGTVLWIVIGLLALAALSAVPSLLSNALSEAGVL
jgi:hypothetical protein